MRARRIDSMRAAAGLLLAALLACAAAPVAALSSGEIAARARAIGGAGGDAAGEQRSVAQLGELVLAFIELSDAAARAGGESARRAELRAAFEAIDKPLEAIYRARSGRLETLSRTVMDQDGDLDALYESAEFIQSQSIAAAALYYRNWLDYYGARLYDGARKKELLEAAEKGFSELAGGEQSGELQTESLLGRGLCHLELGDAGAALRDLQLVVDAPSASPERKAKARLAMLDAYGRAGRTQDALRFSDQILRGGGLPPADVTLVRFVRLETLFDAAEKAKGADAERYRREASALMETLRGAGKGWADKVDALMVARVDDPRAWAGKAESPRVQWELARLMLAKNDHAGAMPLLQQLVASTDADAKPLQAEAHYWLGVAQFKSADFAAAAGELDAALSGGGEWAAEARYLRFKALETLMAQPQADPGLAERYRAALADFLAQSPDHALAYEARYRLGEYLQSGGEFAAAIDEYAKVGGDPAYVLRARFGTLQSRFELLKTDADPPARLARLNAIGADLDAVESQAKALHADKKAADALPDIEAKATLLRAVYLTLNSDQGDEQVAALLADFARRFPAQPDLQAQAVRLRLGALLALARFTEAEQAVGENAAVLAAEAHEEQLAGLASGFRQAAARRKTQGDAAGEAAAARTALALYALAGDGDARQQMETAQLREATGDLAAAAAVYAAMVEADPNALLALRGLARVTEAQGKSAEAQALWAKYAKQSKPGDLGWFQGEYQQARLQLAGGDAKGACERLTALKPAMPALTDVDLRRDLGALYERACG